jgi:predicted P-loop ATPase
VSEVKDYWGRPLSLYVNGFFDNEPRDSGFTAEEVVSFLTDFDEPGCDVATCVGKECPAKTSATSWSPVEYDGADTRANANVRAVNYLVIDLDHLRAGDLDRIRASFGDYEHVVHSTHSHAPGDEAYRVVFPLSRPATPQEWPRVWGSFVRVLGLPADQQCKDPSRLYGGPTCRAGAPSFSDHSRGEPVDVDEALEVAEQLGLGRARPAPAPRATSDAPPPSSAPAAVDLAALRERLAEARRSKAHGDERAKEQADLLGRVLDGRAIAEVGARHGARVRVAGLLAHWLPGGTPWEVALELLRPCLVATPLADGESFDAAVEKTRALYEDSMRGRVAADEKRAAEDAAIKAIAKKIKNKAGASHAEIAEAAGGDEDAWQDQLILARDGVKGNEWNARLILTCAPETRGMIRWNEMAKRVEVVGGALAGVPVDDLPVAAAALAQKEYAFGGGKHVMADALLRVARENPRDPLREYLGEVAWDGAPRLDTFLEAYVGAAVDSDERRRYVRAVSRRWLISLVARALRPGCKVDTVLILEGAQGLGKSSALEALVGSEYFLDTALDIGSKDSMQAIAGAWLVELAELASFRRADTERVKSFLTSKVDKFRPPYGATLLDSPRRCVVAGTCNPEEGVGYLKDRTGNRRFWPVAIDRRPDLDGIRRDRELILAEAVRALNAGERWHLDHEEGALAAEETDLRMEEESPIITAIGRWWRGERPERRPRQVTSLDVAEMALKMDAREVDRSVQTQIGYAMTLLGFERGSGRERPRRYLATEELLSMPQETPAARQAGLALVRGLKDAKK